MRIHVVKADESPFCIVREDLTVPVFIVGERAENILRLDKPLRVMVPLFPHGRLEAVMIAAMVDVWAELPAAPEGHLWLVTGNAGVGLAACVEPPP